MYARIVKKSNGIITKVFVQWQCPIICWNCENVMQKICWKKWKWWSASQVQWGSEVDFVFARIWRRDLWKDSMVRNLQQFINLTDFHPLCYSSKDRATCIRFVSILTPIMPHSQICTLQTFQLLEVSFRYKGVRWYFRLFLNLFLMLQFSRTIN